MFGDGFKKKRNNNRILTLLNKSLTVYLNEVISKIQRKVCEME